MSIADRMRQKLQDELAPVALDIVDESAEHAGHAGAPAGGESHFRLHIVADVFAGLGRIDRQRLVHRILAEELDGPVHALSITARSTDEN